MVSDIAIFFEPVPSDLIRDPESGSIGASVLSYSDGQAFPNVEKGSITIFGVCEGRRSDFPQTQMQDLNALRKSLYDLKNHFGNLRLTDLGNIGAGETVEDTYYAVSSTVASIVKQGGIAVILGGSQDLTYANYLAYEKLEQVVNLVSVDGRFDLGDVEDEIHADRYLQKIILHKPNILFNFSNLAYQTHHVLAKEIELFKKMFFDIYRLGEVHSDMESVEPVVRNADIVSMDLCSIRKSDFAVNPLSEPNGLYGEEACAVARYAGLSDKLSSIGFYHLNGISSNQQSSNLAAQLVWYFMWGVSKRKSDYPFADKANYTKYLVTLQDGQYDLVFYKSPRSDRWWMEVPYPSTRGAQYERHFMVPCNYRDYQMACEGDIPNRWWQTYQKLG